MTNRTVLSLLTLAALLAPMATSLPVDAKPTPPSTHPCDANTDCKPPKNPGNPGQPDNPDPGVQVSTLPLIDCRVPRSPADATDDVFFRNIGNVEIPAGTRVYWVVKETGDHGYYFLTADLLPGKELIDANALHAPADPAIDHCRSQIM